MLHKTFAILLILASYAACALAEETLIFRKSNDWCPYECDPTKSEGKRGFLTDVIDAIFADNYDLRYVDFAFDRSIKIAETGEITGVLGVYRSDAPHLLLPQHHIGVSSNVFFVHRDYPWRYTGGQSLTRIRPQGWVLFSGYTYPEFADFLANDPPAVKLQSGTLRVTRLLKMIALGRIQTIYDDQYVLTYALKQANLDDQVIDAGGPDIQNPVYVGFSPTRPKLVEEFDRGVTRLQAAGDLAVILSRYGIDAQSAGSKPEQ